MTIDVTGYLVFVTVRVHNNKNGKIIRMDTLRHFTVHPPYHCRDSFMELHMHLEHGAKLQYLYELRRQAKNPNYPYTQSTFNETKQIIQVDVIGWQCPADSEGHRQTIALRERRE